LDDVASRISFAADGNRFVFIRDRRGRGESALLVADSSGNPPQPITLLRYPDHIAAAEWSPDGKTIAYCTVETLENKEQAGMIYLYSVETGVTRRLGDKYWGYLTNIVWQPDGTAVFLNGQNDPKSNIQIWRVRLADATAERVTNNANDYRGLSAARNSNTLVTVKTEMHCGISVAALNKSTATAEGNASPIVETNLPGLSGLDWTPDGKIIYTTLENSVFSLWRIDSDGSNQTQLLGNELDRVLPDVSLDNRYIVYAAGAIESKHIWRVNTDGTSEIQLTDGEDEKVPQITPDGKWVVFAQITAGKPTLAKIPIEGGKIVQLSEMEAQYPVVSPDGRTIAFLLMEPTLGRIALMSIEGGAPTKIFPEPISFAGKPFFSMLLRFSPDGQSINFIKNEKGVSNLFAQPLDGKPVKKITNFSTGEIFYFDFSPDGSRLALARGSQTSDVLQINLPN
jgi:TolB protein